jgi:hypothetical protein
VKEKHIQASPEFAAMSQAEVDEALNTPGEPTPAAREVGRLLVAYVDLFHECRPVTVDEVLKATPSCCAPIEEKALNLAAQVIREPQLLIALQTVIPGLRKTRQSSRDV